MLEVRPFSNTDRRFVEILARNEHEDDSILVHAAHSVRDVRDRGTAALLDCLRQNGWNGAAPEKIRVREEEIAEARMEVSESFLTAVSLARVNLRKFHEYQRRRGYQHDDGDGVRLAQRVMPLKRVGIVCQNSFSSLLMCAVPAQVAGVEQIVVAATPDADGSLDPHLLATAKVMGITEVYRMGGAHAVAALAYGAGSVEGVDKIVGPGGAVASAAKRLVAGKVGVEFSVFPADLAVIADAASKARFIAADLLAQAELSGGDGAGVLFATDRLLAEAVRIELERMAEELPNRESMKALLCGSCALFVCKNVYEAVAAANLLAPSRLVLSTEENEAALADIENAGAVFMGPWSGETISDALVGINQLTPAAGAARYASGLGVDDFVREMTLVDYSPARLAKTGRHMTLLAEAEGGMARAGAVRERLEVLRYS